MLRSSMIYIYIYFIYIIYQTTKIRKLLTINLLILPFLNNIFYYKINKKNIYNKIFRKQ